MRENSLRADWLCIGWRKLVGSKRREILTGDISFARACILISVSNMDKGVREGKNCGSNL